MPKILPIVLHPHPALKKKAADVASVDSAIRETLFDMLETLHQANGVGLAAPQVDVGQRLIVIHDTEGEPGSRQYKDTPPLLMVNPTIVARSDEVIDSEEGCLSIPLLFDVIRRNAEVTVRYLDENGKEHEITEAGLLSRALQHEIDHLDGVLFTDHLSKLKRDMLLKKYSKIYDAFEEELKYKFIKP